MRTCAITCLLCFIVLRGGDSELKDEVTENDFEWVGVLVSVTLGGKVRRGGGGEEERRLRCAAGLHE